MTKKKTPKPKNAAKEERIEYWSINSIEDGVISMEIEDGDVVAVPRHFLPAKIREGDVFHVTISRDEQGVVISIIPGEDEMARRLEYSKKQVGTPSTDPVGDIVL